MEEATKKTGAITTPEKTHGHQSSPTAGRIGATGSGIVINKRMATNVCDKHGTFKLYKIGYKNKIIMQGCPKCKAEKIEQSREDVRSRAKADELANNFRDAKIPMRFQGLTLAGIIRHNDEIRNNAAVIGAYLNNYPAISKRGASGFLSGDCGTGKTMFACIMITDIIKQGFSAQYTTAWRMIQNIRHGYNKNITESVMYFVDQYIQKSFLVIDEVGVQHGTEDERVLLYQVIDGRYNEAMPTVLISNSKNPVEDGYIDLRTIDRLRDGGGFSLSFSGESYRK